jgi:hypothetical protein
VSIIEPSAEGGLYEGRIASAPDADDMVTVVIPAFDKHLALGPCRYDPHPTATPEVGDLAIVALATNEGGDMAEPYVVSLLPDVVGVGGSSAPGFAATIGDGVATSYVVTHNLGTRDILPRCREVSAPYAFVEPTFSATTTDTLTVTFGVAPATNSRRVIVKAI